MKGVTQTIVALCIALKDLKSPNRKCGEPVPACFCNAKFACKVGYIRLLM